MKPRDKVVTAEDITSSLYFLHVEQPEDADLVVPPEFRLPNYAEQGSAASNGPPQPAVQRKAIPAASVTHDLPPRKPVSRTLAPVEQFGNRQNISAGNYAQESGLLGPDYNQRRSFESSQYQGENNRLSPSPRRSSGKPRPVGTSLTLIRRDPASGAQWNVARIEDPPVAEVSSSSFNDPGAKRRTGAPLYIDVVNPGYSKFLHSDNATRSTTPGHQSGDPAQSYQRAGAPQSGRQGPESANVFRRRLWMEGSQYTNGGFGHRKNSSYDFNPVRPGSRGSYDARTDRTSMDTRTTQPPFLTRDDQTYSTIQVSDRPTSFRGYVFTSPWNGRCEFVTGGGGGSLKASILLIL
jgi:hypothetical protein